MLAPIASMRRKLVVAAGLSLCLMVFCYAGELFDVARFGMIVPIPSDSPILPSHNTTDTTDHPPSTNDQKFLNPDLKTSKFHLLIPASQSNLHFCYHLASALVNRYPVPKLLGWNGKGEFDAGITHLAKLRAMKRYLRSMSAKGEGDDLVMIVDGYDVIHQLPPEVVIERYFEVAAKANADLAQRWGVTVEDIAAKNMKQTVFFGPDKLCWPPDPRAARCWAAPASTLGVDAFGPDKGPEDLSSKDPRWLNSGTIIGPLADMRKVVDAAIEEIDATYDVEFEQSDSDQYYLANIWGRQEYQRKCEMVDGDELKDASPYHPIPENENDSRETELHMAIEYESALFQTKTGNEPFMGYLQYNLVDQTASINIDLFSQGEQFRPYSVRMPDNVRMALMKLFDSVPDVHPGVSAESWVKLVHLGTNFVTKQIFGLWHCTGPKEFVGAEYAKMWFHPFVKSLLQESVKAAHRDEPISTKLIDGRRWVSKWAYPKDDTGDEHGGGWSDEGPGKFVTWNEMCGHHEDILFWGQQATGLI